MLTAKEIADRLGVPQHRIEHVVLSRRIDPARIIGGTRVFDQAGIDAIEAGLRETAVRRTSRALPRIPSSAESRG
jgi:hypothetical protein